MEEIKKNIEKIKKSGFTFYKKIMGFNIIMILLTVPVFVSFVIVQVREDRQRLMEYYHEQAQEISTFFDLCVRREMKLVENMVNFMQDTKPDREGMTKFLEYSFSGGGYVSIIDIADYGGTAFHRGEDTHISLETISYADCDAIRNICDYYIAKGISDEDKACEVKALSSFDCHFLDEKVTAFYDTVVVGEKQLLVLYTVRVQDIVRFVESNAKTGKGGFVLADDGSLLSEPPEDDVYQAILEQISSRDAGGELKEHYINQNYGTVTFGSPEGEITFSYSEVGGVDWYYICNLTSGKGEGSSIVFNLIFGLLFFVAFPWIMNCIFIFVQSKVIKKSYDVLCRSNEKLERANNAKDVFLENMSHEIRTPINVVMGFNEMIIRESDNENILEYAYKVRYSANMLSGVVNDILDLTRIETGKMGISETDYSLKTLITELVNMSMSHIGDKKLRLEVDADRAMPEKLYGDDRRIKQIILNLLSNAIKYTNEGHVLLKIGFEKLDDNEIELLVSVSDTGIGIRKEDMDKLLIRFERFDERKNRNIEGTGIGLNIVSSLLELMGSRLEVESEYGIGSRFSFKLRQRVTDWKEMGEWENSACYEEKKQEEGKALFTAAKARILFVDDTELNLKVATNLLKRNRMTIDVAKSGRECIHMVENTRYDIIFMDHKMPEMDGIETLKYLRVMSNGDVPIIAMTANARANIEEYYASKGFADYINKPIDAEKLERMVMKHLSPEVID